MNVAERGAYLTESRAERLQRQIDEQNERMDRLEHRLKLVTGFPLDLAKTISTAVYDAVASYAGKTGPE
jgi:hypothetical protein